MPSAKGRLAWLDEWRKTGDAMRKLLSAFSVIVLVAGTAFSQKTDRERAGLKGPVKTVRVKLGSITSENGKETKSPLLLSYVVNYDQAGNRSDYTLFDENGNVSRKITYEFDPETKRGSGLVVYNSQNSIIRKVSNKYGPNGTQISKTITDFNEDGTVYRRTEITFGSLGDLIEVAQFNADGSPVKNESRSTNESGTKNVESASRPEQEEEDRILTFGQRSGEYFDPDAHGNWTRGKTASISRTYESGRKITKSEWTYREFTYY
jgi:hypothetical protein